jgi:hypothetical protein
MLTALLAGFCGTASAGGVVPGFTTKNATLLESRGLPMSEQDAMERITFRPFVPSSSYVEVALLPAQHGDDKDVPQNRGIGFEYVFGGHEYVLSEWPVFPGSLAAYPAAVLNGSCTTGRLILGTPLHPRAFGWTTAALVFALQPDVDPGVNPNVKALKAEWTRLVKRGACR